MTNLRARTTSAFRIRLAVKTDAAAVRSLLRESFAEYESLYNPESFAATAIPSEEVAVIISAEPLTDPTAYRVGAT